MLPNNTAQCCRYSTTLWVHSFHSVAGFVYLENRKKKGDNHHTIILWNYPVTSFFFMSWRETNTGREELKSFHLVFITFSLQQTFPQSLTLRSKTFTCWMCCRKLNELERAPLVRLLHNTLPFNNTGGSNSYSYIISLIISHRHKLLLNLCGNYQTLAFLAKSLFVFLQHKHFGNI